MIGAIVLGTTSGGKTSNSLTIPTDLVRHIRNDRSRIQADTGAQILVGGTTASNIDVSTKLSSALSVFLIVVVGLAFLLLTFAFRTILVPIKSIVGFLLSIAAAFGAEVAVFQWVWGQRLFGITPGETKVITAGGSVGHRQHGRTHDAAPRDVEQALSSTPTAELLALPVLSPQAITTSTVVYGLAKRANQPRVAAAAHRWGQRRARVNSLSPGIIATPMGQAELANSNGDAIHVMISASASGRIGTADDIAAAVDFLTGPHATFITGTDLLVDGGVIAAHRNGRINIT